jgi:hypothetical protein
MAQSAMSAMSSTEKAIELTPQVLVDAFLDFNVFDRPWLRGWYFENLG